MVFRTNFLFFWVFLNGVYFLLVIFFVSVDADSPRVINDGSFGYMEIYSLYLASLVVFKSTAAIIFVIMWRQRIWSSKSGHKLPSYNLNKEFKRIKKAHINGDSTDDEEINAKVNVVCEERENNDTEVSLMASVFRGNAHLTNHSILRASVLQELITVKGENSSDEDNDDLSDHDSMEFEAAEVEEAEDRIREVY